MKDGLKAIVTVTAIFAIVAAVAVLFWITKPTIDHRCVDGRVQTMDTPKGEHFVKTNVECQAK